MTFNLRKGIAVPQTQIPGDTNCTFTLTNLQLANAGAYFVVVTNVAGNAPNSSNAYVTVMEPLTNKTAWPGSNVTFSFQAASAYPNASQGTNSYLRYLWWFNQTNLLSVVTNLRATVTNIVLNLTNVQAAHEGSYSVVLTNGFGLATTQSATLTLLRPPVITAQPVSQTLPTGSDTAFSVSADGTAPMSYQWWHHQTNLLASATAPTLPLTNIQPSQAGAYHVVVTNAIGSVTSAVATLTVTLNEPPRFDPTTGLLTAGGPVQFSFQGQAGLSYSVLWTNLLGGNPEDWPVLTNIPLLNASQPVLIQDDPTGQGQRFYRLRTPMK
jgi:hypothetical protein